VFSALASSAAFAKDPASQIVSCRRVLRSSANENNRALAQEKAQEKACVWFPLWRSSATLASASFAGHP
jgi:hypothetical protein